jgi:hypothetical protein
VMLKPASPVGVIAGGGVVRARSGRRARHPHQTGSERIERCASHVRRPVTLKSPRRKPPVAERT